MTTPYRSPEERLDDLMSQQEPLPALPYLSPDERAPLELEPPPETDHKTTMRVLREVREILKRQLAAEGVVFTMSQVEAVTRNLVGALVGNYSMRYLPLRP